jgi:hypothetical protein
MIKKKICLKLGGEKIKTELTGEQAKKALSELYESLVKIDGNRDENPDAGYYAICMFLQLFGEEITKKLLLFCEQNPGKAVKKMKRVIRRRIYPAASRQRRSEDRRGVKKYL